MRTAVLSVLLTVAVFAAGFFGGVLTERSRPLPPPPGQFLGEFGPARGFHGGPPPHPWAANRGDLIAQIRSVRPQIEIFRQRMDQINGDFEKGLRAVLTPEQRQRYDIWVKRRAALAGRFLGRGGRFLSDEDIDRSIRQAPAMQAFRMVVLHWELNDLTRSLKLDPSQQAQVLELLRQRREKFLALVDTVPPPSIILSRLASQVRNLQPSSP